MLKFTNILYHGAKKNIKQEIQDGKSIRMVNKNLGDKKIAW